MNRQPKRHQYPWPLRYRLQCLRGRMARSVRRLLRIPTMYERRLEYVQEHLEGKRPTPEQGLRLIRMICNAFCWIRNNSKSPTDVFAIADAFHNLPDEIFREHFSWRFLLGTLESLRQQVPDVGATLLEDFDAIIGFANPSTTTRDGFGATI